MEPKHIDLIDMFNDTYRYNADILTIDNSEFKKHIPDMYPPEFWLKQQMLRTFWILLEHKSCKFWAKYSWYEN